MKDWNKKERWDLASKLEGILGADLDTDEEDAIRDAIRLISPDYAEMRDEDERDAVEWYENTTDEEKDAFVREQIGMYPPPSPDRSGTPAAAPVFDGKILRFGEEKKK